MEPARVAVPNQPALPTNEIGPDGAPLAELGVLLVHGIGEQAQGETLLHFAEPIVDWVRDWLFHEAPDALVASAPLGAALRPPLLDVGVPAHARVLIGTGGSDGEQTEVRAEEWLFAEAWWSPQVLTPPIASFTAWLLTRGSWLLLFHFNQTLLCGRAPGWLKVVLSIPVTLVWLPLSMLINAVLIAASLVALVPIGRLRRAVYAVLHALSGVVGDAYVQIRSPVQRAAFENATLKAMHWLRPRCARLAVIAHSQGAAIAHGTLGRAQAPRADLLVTVGAGITKLEALRYFERLGASERVAALLAPPLLLLAAWIWLRTRQLGLNEAEAALLAPVGLALVGASMLGVAWATARQALAHLRARSARLALNAMQPDLHWCDVVASHDPVPAGNLTRFFELPDVEAKTISVLRSVFNDHTQYWHARASFMPVLVGQLGRCTAARLLALDPDDLRFSTARKRHGDDLRVLGAIKLLDVSALALPLLLAHERLLATIDHLRLLLSTGGRGDRASAPLAFIDDTLGQLEDALGWTADVLGLGPAPWARPVVNGAAAMGLLLAALLLWQRMVFALWQTWSANRNEEALRHPAKVAGDAAEARRGTQARIFRFAGTLMFDGGFAAIVLLPLFVSVTWSLRAGWLDEARTYQLIGTLAGAVFIVFITLAMLSDIAEKFDDAFAWLRRWRLEARSGGWPAGHQLASKILEGSIAVVLAWILFGVVGWLPPRFEADPAVLGVLIVLRGLMYLLDRIWKSLDAAGSGVALKWGLLLPGPAIGAATAVWFAAHTHGAAAASAAAVAAALSAAVVLLLLKWQLRRRRLP